MSCLRHHIDIRILSEKWPQAAQMFLYAVCFVGPSAGSTGSGIKIVYFVIIIKFIYSFISKNFSQPLKVTSIRINQKPVDSSIVTIAICFFILNIFMVLLGGCFMVLTDNMDYITAMSSVIATLMNIGPGFGDVGPSENYAFISDTGKWFLSWNMMAGRLEMFSALAIFYPSFWKK
jgi:trk system potassium uptake protein TrkH